MTGAAGFIGSRVVARLASGTGRVIRVARAALPRIEDAPASVIDVIGDVTDRATWEAVADADIVFHFAAQTGESSAADDADASFRANVMPIRHLRAVCGERRRRPIVVFAGTATEAGIPTRLPVNEDQPDDPVTAYDRHKLMAENDLKAAAADGAIWGATLRLSNVYGPGAAGKGRDRDVLNRMIKAALGGEPLTVYGSGEYLRDYVFVEDVVDAFLEAADHAANINGRHFIVGSGRGVSIRGAFELISARVELLTGRRVAVVTMAPPTALSDIQKRNFVADPSRFSAATGWRPSWSLSDGIDRTIEAFA